jgi:hypothetical protein
MARGLRSLAAIGLAAGAMAIVAAPASAATTTIGKTFAPQTGTPCTINTAILQSQDDGSPSYAAPTAGTITSWSTQPDPIVGTGHARLKVYRLVGGNVWSVVGESNAELLTPNTLNTFSTSIPVNAGDRIAILATSGDFDCGLAAPASNVTAMGDGMDHAPGTSETFGFSVPSFHVDVSAVLTTPTTTPTPTPGPTGQQAAALKKCKKKHSARARRKCRKRARTLPV